MSPGRQIEHVRYPRRDLNRSGLSGSKGLGIGRDAGADLKRVHEVGGIEVRVVTSGITAYALWRRGQEA